MSSIGELDDVAEAMGVLAKVDWVEMAGDVTGSALAEISSVRATLDAIEARATGAFDRSRAWMADGSKSSGAWLAHRTRAPKGDHDRHRHRARGLDKMPAVRQAFLGGEITARHVDALVWARANRDQHFADAERFLVTKATTLRWRSFRIALRHWMNVVDPDRTDKDRRKQAHARYLHASRSLDGMGRIDGWLEPIAFQAFNTALERIEKHLFEADWADARSRCGDQATAADLLRTPAQRRADALVEMAHRALTAPKDGKRPLPLVNIVCDWDTYQNELAKLAGLDPLPVTHGTCRLDDGEPIAPADMFHQALLGEVRRVVFDTKGVTIDMGRRTRLFTGAVRDAVMVRYQTCAHPTCDLPATRCEVDHIVEWQHGGRTDQDNGQPYCDHHNRWKSRDGP